jgi:hypothetical protein
VSIVTSRGGVARRLEGEIDSDGAMLLTDAFDGEIWSTYRRRATSTLIEVNDFLLVEELSDPTWGRSLVTLVLSRDPPDE